MSKKIINITAAAMALAVTLSCCATAVVHQCLVFVVESPGFHARHAGQS